MTLDPCQLPANYTTKLTAVKRFIVQKIDDGLGTIYDSTLVDITVDFGTITVNNVVTDGLTNKIKQVFGDVSTDFISTVRTDAIAAAQTDYITAHWTTASFVILPGELPRYLSVDMTFTGTCPLP